MSPYDFAAFANGCSHDIVTLHLSNETDRYWKVRDYHSLLFAHPTLQSLTLSCAEIDAESVSKLASSRPTPLKQLVLIECNITLEALTTILARPSALVELHLGENCHHMWLNAPHFRKGRQRHINQLCSQNPEAFFSALAAQKHSLKTLSYSVRGPSKKQVDIEPTCTGFSEFEKLQHVELDGYCPYFEAALATARTTAPNLKSLTAKGDMFRLQFKPGFNPIEDFAAQVHWMLDVASHTKSLQDVRIVSSQTFTNVSRAHREAVVELGETFKKMKVDMRLFKRLGQGSIPPFLYGETPYAEELVFDARGVGFTREFGSSGSREDDDIDF